jgi:nucleotide-binding universal stress UspA family protein
MAVGRFRRVLVGFDGSPDAAEALRVAAAIAGLDGGHVVALSVTRPGLGTEGAERQDNESRELHRLAEACFDELKRGLVPGDGVRTSVQVVVANHNNAGQVLSDYAEQHGFDILVLGRHGEGMSRRSRLGRVADAAARASSLPVLLLSAR